MKNNKKDCFIKEIDLLLKNGKIKLSEEAFDFFQDLTFLYQKYFDIRYVVDLIIF